MFKELKVLKIAILLLAVALVIIINKTENGLPGIFQTEKSSYFSDESVLIMAKPEEGNNPLVITDINNKEVYSHVLSGSASPETFLFNLIENGENYNEKVDLDVKLEPGLYKINDNYPLVIKTNEITDVAVVFPYLNSMLYRNIRDSSFIGNVQMFFNDHNPSQVNQIDVNLNKFLSQNNVDFGYYTDIDLSESGNWTESKLVIMIGNIKFLTQDAHNNLMNFCKSGGNVLFLPQESSKYKLIPVKNGYELASINGSDWKHLENKIPFDSDERFVAKSGGVSVTKEGFYGENYVPIISTYWSGIFEEVDTTKFLSFDIAEIELYDVSKDESKIISLGYYEIPNSSGKLFNLGTDAWLWGKNVSNESSQKFLMNCINYLLKN